MNKKLIALAIASATVVPAAMAQTASPVTLYGRVYETLESVSAGAGGAAAEVSGRSRISDQASLLGVRGKEDLGGGLKAFFQLETSFHPDQNDASGSSSFANRNSGIGLEGGWGSFLLGRWDMPYKVSTYPVDYFGDLTLGGITGVGHDQGNFDRRDQNVVQYWTPSFGGFVVKLAATTNENKSATLNPHDEGALLAYNHGPLYAFFAYEGHKDPSAAVNKEEGYSGGGHFGFGPLKVGLVYEEIKKTAASGGASINKRKSWLANVVYSMGSNDFVYQYQNGKDGAAETAAEQPSCNSNTVAFKHKFTKRTFILAMYTKVDNNAVGTCNFGSNKLGIAPGNDPEGVALGFYHVF